MRIAYHLDGLPLADYVRLPLQVRAVIDDRLDALIDQINRAEAVHRKEGRR